MIEKPPHPAGTPRNPDAQHDPDGTPAKRELQEQRRLAALRRFRILDTERERGFDDIVQIASQICHVPMALISLVDADRQWFKAGVGVDVAETPRDIAFCSHAIEQNEVFVIPDAARDARFVDNPLVTGDMQLRFYAGAPLETKGGELLGTLCVLDRKPRDLSATQRAALQALARQVINQLELRSALMQQRADERRHRLIIDSAIDYAIISIDLGGRVTSWNAGAQHLMQWTDGEMVGRPCAEFFTPEDRAAQVPEREMTAALTRARGNDERWHVRKDGTRFWASGEMNRLTDDDGKPLGYIKILRDRTERRHAQQRQTALLELSDRLRDMRDTAEMSYVAAEIMGRTLDVARAGYGLVGADQETMVITCDWTAGGIASAVGTHSLDRYGRYVDDLRRGVVVVVADTAADPRTSAGALEATDVRSLINLPLLEQGKVVAMFFVNCTAPRAWTALEVSFVREVAERSRLAIARRRAEFELKELAETLERQVETRLRERNRLWASTNDLMGTAGFDGRLQESNPAWERLFGWGPAEMLGRPLLDLIEERDRGRTQQVIERLRRGEPVADFVNHLAAKDGTLHAITWNAVPDGEVFFIVGRDITAQRHVEERLRQSQKMEAIGQLTGGIAHDFNNLLTGILGSIDLIRVRLKDGRTDGIERFMTAASASAQRAAALTHRLLAFSRRQSLDAKSSDVNQLVQSMEDLLCRTLGERMELETVLADDVWPAMTDANQLESSILNLAINARDAMPEGGRLTIETANATLDAGYARANPEVTPGDYVLISVSDTGVGMSPAIIAKVFEPFFTTKPIGQGTGLGLSMIYGFVQQSSGHVRIYSEVGHGSTIRLYLPRAATAADTAIPAQGAPAARGHGETVLVVEDEPTVRSLVTEVLEELGYQYLEAADAHTAIPILKSPQRIDLLVTDVGLPVMNGRQLAEIARQQRPDLRVLFITGYAENATVRGGFLEPGMDMLTKPFALDALSLKLQTMLKSATH